MDHAFSNFPHACAAEIAGKIAEAAWALAINNARRVHYSTFTTSPISYGGNAANVSRGVLVTSSLGSRISSTTSFSSLSG
jgi:hypothetical protein